MNAALDALWWRLTRPEVRDLASILAMPMCWQHDAALSVRELLGEMGFRYLLDLNDDLSFRLPEREQAILLGKYAEDLLAFWLSHAPHCRLLARNVPILNDENQTLGELDFIAQINGKIYHIELACKYFGAETGLPENMCGLNRNDTLLKKINQFHHQLHHLQSDAGKRALHFLADEIKNQPIQSLGVNRGMLFTRSGDLPPHPHYPPNAWTGQRIEHIDELISDDKTMFYRIPKTALLSPARISGSLKMSAQECGNEDGFIAEVVARPDGHYHEIRRIMLKKSI